MTRNEQRIAIARACGWKNFNSASHEGSIQYGQPPNAPHNSWELPDYLNDLNAMHEAEKVLTPKHQPAKGESQWGEYLGWLGFCVEYNTREVYECVTATASQRAEAFLRTLGLWQETSTQPQ
jgi:hypothetical protein